MLISIYEYTSLLSSTVILNLNMPSSKREETKEKKVPFKNCSGFNWSNRWDFYDSKKKISFCRMCKINYFLSNEAIKIFAVKFLLFNYFMLKF